MISHHSGRLLVLATAIALSLASVGGFAFDSCPGTIVSVNTWSTGAYAVERARQEGLGVLLLRTQDVPEWAVPSHQRAVNAAGGSEIVIPSHAEVDAAVQSLMPYRERIRAVQAGSESPGVQFAQQVGGRLGLPSMTDTDALNAMTNKVALARYLERTNHPFIPFVEVYSRAQLENVAPTLALPRLIKPDNSAGSTAVRVVHDIHALMAAYDESARSPRDGPIPMNGAIIQPFIYDPNAPYEYPTNMYGDKVTGVWEYRKKLLTTSVATQLPMYDVHILLPSTDPRVRGVLIPDARRFKTRFARYTGALHLESFLPTDPSRVPSDVQHLFAGGRSVPVDAGFRFAGGLMAESEVYATGNSQVELLAKKAKNDGSYDAVPDVYTTHKQVAVFALSNPFAGGSFTLDNLPELEASLKHMGCEIFKTSWYYEPNQPMKTTIDLDTCVGLIAVGCEMTSDIEEVIRSTKVWIDTLRFRK